MTFDLADGVEQLMTRRQKIVAELAEVDQQIARVRTALHGTPMPAAKAGHLRRPAGNGYTAESGTWLALRSYLDKSHCALTGAELAARVSTTTAPNHLTAAFQRGEVLRRPTPGAHKGRVPFLYALREEQFANHNGQPEKESSGEQPVG